MCERENSQAYVHLEGVVDAPLQSGQGTDHDNTQREAAGEESRPAGIKLLSACMPHHCTTLERLHR